MLKPTTRQWLVCGLVLALLGAGCGLLDPKDSSPLPNTPPETILTATPPDTTTHEVQLFWKGQDQDGVIMYYETSLDGAAWERTEETDIEIFLEVTDPSVHTFSVRAVDDKEAVDESPAEVTFTATNIAPETRLLRAPDNSPTAGAIGAAFTFEANGEDVDDDVFFWRYRLDEDDWSEWGPDSVFAFGDPTWVENAIDLLVSGEHTFYVQVKDASGLEDETPASIAFEVDDTAEPTTNFTGTQVNGANTYADNSMYSDADGLNDITVAWSASASDYQGAVAGYAYFLTETSNIEGAEFSEWTLETALSVTDLPAASYVFVVKSIDTAGNEDSAPETVYVNVVDFAAEYDPTTVLVLNETRDGTGGPGSPSADQVAEYYGQMMAGRDYVFVNYFDLQTTLSPGVARGYTTIIWIDDDSSEHWMFADPLEENIRFLNEFRGLAEQYTLEEPPRLVLSHWNLFGASAVDSTFLYNTFGLTGQTSNGNDRTFTGAEGAGPAAGITLTVDAAKLPPPFQGKMNKTWAMTTPEGGTTLSTWVSAEPDEMSGLDNAYYYPTDDLEVVVLGYPLYFVDGAPEFMDEILTLFGL